MAVSPFRELSSASKDVSLVESAINRDEQAYTALYRRHAPYIAGVIYRILGSWRLDTLGL